MQSEQQQVEQAFADGAHGPSGATGATGPTGLDMSQELRSQLVAALQDADALLAAEGYTTERNPTRMNIRAALIKAGAL